MDSPTLRYFVTRRRKMRILLPVEIEIGETPDCRMVCTNVTYPDGNYIVHCAVMGTLHSEVQELVEAGGIKPLGEVRRPPASSGE